jgi:predicted TIM-barrel fold metal-dependent hydrolase
VYGCFFRDQHGIASLDAIGVDNVTFETDYPHSDSTWPHSKEVATKLMGHLDDDVIRKLVRGNAIRLLDLPFAP